MSKSTIVETNDPDLRNLSPRSGLERISIERSRRSFLTWCGAVGLTATIGLTAWRTDQTSRVPVKEQFDVFHPALEGIIRPITIIQVTDIHFGFYFETDDLASLVTNLNAIEADALILTGDIFHCTRSDVQDAIPLLKELIPRRHGNYAVTGNHEH